MTVMNLIASATCEGYSATPEFCRETGGLPETGSDLRLIVLAAVVILLMGVVMRLALREG